MATWGGSTPSHLNEEDEGYPSEMGDEEEGDYSSNEDASYAGRKSKAYNGRTSKKGYQGAGERGCPLFCGHTGHLRWPIS